MKILIPFISTILFRLGGVGRDDRFLPFMRPSTPIANKGWRWGMGIIIGPFIWRGWLIYLLTIITYFFATNIVNYGEGQIWRKWLGKNGAWLFYGFSLGLASLPALWALSIAQAFFASISFWTLMKLSNDGFRKWKLDHAWVEIGTGFLGTIFYVCK